MKKVAIIILASIACFSIISCRSYYAASSENAYQESLNLLKGAMASDGYAIAGQSSTNGYHDKETYQFSNNDGETVQFTYEVHRGENDGVVFIDEVNPAGCSTSNPEEFDRYCGDNGVHKTVMKKTLQKDTQGSRISPGKTVGAVIGGSVAFGVLVVLLEFALLKSASTR
jgi:hypothetical protein